MSDDPIAKLQTEMAELRASIVDLSELSMRVTSLDDSTRKRGQQLQETIMHKVQQYVQTVVVVEVNSLKDKFSQLNLRMQAERLRVLNNPHTSGGDERTIAGTAANLEVGPESGLVEHDTLQVVTAMKGLCKFFREQWGSLEKGLDLVADRTDAMWQEIKDSNERFLSELETLRDQMDVHLADESALMLEQKLASYEAKIGQQLTTLCDGLRSMLARLQSSENIAEVISELASRVHGLEERFERFEGTTLAIVEGIQHASRVQEKATQSLIQIVQKQSLKLVEIAELVAPGMHVSPVTMSPLS